MILLILMWCLWMLALFCWDVLGSLIQMLFTMVDLSCIKERKLLLPMTPAEIVQFEHEKKTNAKHKGVFDSEKQQAIKLNPLFCLLLNLILMSYMTLMG